MKRTKQRRGISLGTIVMLILTMVVAGGMLRILPKFMGDTHMVMDLRQHRQEAFDLSDVSPELTLIDIPIDPLNEMPTPAIDGISH